MYVYGAARKVKEFARDLVMAMEREAARRSSSNGRDGYASAARMAYSRAETFLYFEFPTDVYEQIREEFRTEIENRRTMQPLEERLERQKSRQWLQSEERSRRPERSRARIRPSIGTAVLIRRQNSAPPGQPGYNSDLLRLHRFVWREPRGFAGGMLFSILRKNYPEEYRELVAERDVNPQTRRGARPALARNLISQESYAAVLAGEITLQRAREVGPNRTPDGLQKVSRASRSSEPRPCLCGCGGTIRGGRFLPGHHSKLVAAVRRRLRTDPILAGLTQEQRSYARERNLVGWRGVSDSLL